MIKVLLAILFMILSISSAKIDDVEIEKLE